MTIETICKYACGFYSFLAVVIRNKMSDDGRAEAMALASCIQQCTDTFGPDVKPPPYAPPGGKGPSPSAPR